MRFIWLLFLALPATAEEWVRVRLSQENQKVYNVTGSVHRLQGGESPYQTVAIPQLQKITLKYDGRWLVEGFKRFPLVFNTKNIILEGFRLAINGKPMPDKLVLNAADEKVNIIALLPLEKYVVGVLAHEMPRSWPLETLKAQAIAARSYALAVKNERKDKIFHLESSVLDQVYGLLPDEDLRERFGSVLEAVVATKDQVLVGTKSKVLKAYYHADCGGETASGKDVWNTHDDMVAVKDSYCPQNPKSKWEMNINSKGLTERLRSWAPPGSKTIALVKPLYKEQSTRVSEVEVQWDQGEKKLIPANIFRQALGFFELKSTNFKVRESEGLWKIEGQGFGHGVGLCQWGSRYLGQQGWDAKSILRHYYPKAQIDILRSQIPL